ncbi:unnamed protein product [Protopolystoma xenopodis]|uniref:Secreted protein n=1 Tax=Protopolystoma xenopodis TaxID=117903 RepID=A0A448WKY6_9PLAT|nr:unnamed protein product [Protopolystoma xenopodis]
MHLCGHPRMQSTVTKLFLLIFISLSSFKRSTTASGRNAKAAFKRQTDRPPSRQHANKRKRLGHFGPTNQKAEPSSRSRLKEAENMSENEAGKCTVSIFKFFFCTYNFMLVWDINKTSSHHPRPHKPIKMNRKCNFPKN